MDLYLIPGLGADKRLFAKLELGGHDPHCLEWPEMPEGSGLADYARALAAQVDANAPHALIGVSMGGMVAQELAAITHPRKVVIVSSWKGPQEMPTPLRMLRGTHPERLLTPAMLQRMLPVVRWQMGVERDDTALFDQLIAVHPIGQLKAQINACLTWDGPATPVKDLVHIHGDHDRLMPIANIHGAWVIEGGSHFMVYNKAKAVGEELRKALQGV
ncbi:MAG: alpha/beta hydrolase [Flavobacteriales bacterium]|nr:alpha/beta hydrolase [Flavobacteriales bacterium]